jgi:hypothetical protein
MVDQTDELAVIRRTIRALQIVVLVLLCSVIGLGTMVFKGRNFRSDHGISGTDVITTKQLIIDGGDQQLVLGPYTPNQGNFWTGGGAQYFGLSLTSLDTNKALKQQLSLGTRLGPKTCLQGNGCAVPGEMIFALASIDLQSNAFILARGNDGADNTNGNVQLKLDQQGRTYPEGGELWMYASGPYSLNQVSSDWLPNNHYTHPSSTIYSGSTVPLGLKNCPNMATSNGCDGQ